MMRNNQAEIFLESYFCLKIVSENFYYNNHWKKSLCIGWILILTRRKSWGILIVIWTYTEALQKLHFFSKKGRSGLVFNQPALIFFQLLVPSHYFFLSVSIGQGSPASA